MYMPRTEPNLVAVAGVWVTYGTVTLSDIPRILSDFEVVCTTVQSRLHNVGWELRRELCREVAADISPRRVHRGPKNGGPTTTEAAGSPKELALIG